jgi:hypothetical protein
MMKIQTILPALLGLALAAFAGSSSAAQAPDAGIVFAAGLDRKAEIYVLERAGTKRRLTRNRAYDRVRSRLVNAISTIPRLEDARR